MNEYTDWTRPFFHPISLFDSLVDIFSDALIVAPTIRVGLLHSKTSRNTFFYTFAHQTENGDYNPRLGCIHGQDLAYLFGAPLINGIPLSWFSFNYTRNEVSLSENFIYFISNFIRAGYLFAACNFKKVSLKMIFRNPNINHTDVSQITSKYSKKLENLFWPPYEEIQQKFINFGKSSVEQNNKS